MSARGIGIVLLFATLVFGQDKPVKPKPLTPEQGAVKVLEAFRAKDEKARRALAEKDDLDPWDVAEELVESGNHDAAEWFAKAGPLATEGLLEDLISQRAADQATAAFKARDWKALRAVARAGSPRRWLAAQELHRRGHYEAAAAFAKAALATSEGLSPRLVVQRGHSDAVTAVAFSPDSKTVITGSGDRTAVLWNIESGKEIRRFRAHDGNGVCAVGFTPNGRFVLTSDEGGTRTGLLNTIWSWDPTTGLEVSRLASTHVLDRRGAEFLGFLGTPLAAQSQDGRRIALPIGTGNEALLGDMPRGKKRVASPEELKSPLRLRGHSKKIRAISFSPDGKLIATGSQDGTARLWDARSGTQIHRLDGHKWHVASVAFSPDARYLLTGSVSLRLWDTASGTLVREFGGRDHVDAVAFSADGQTALTGHGDSVARLWDVASGRLKRQFDGTASGEVSSVHVSRDARLLVTGHVHHRTHPRARRAIAALWDLSRGVEAKRFAHTDNVAAACPSPLQGRYVFTAGWDDTGRIWDANSGTELRRLIGHSDCLAAASFSADGRTILTGSDDGTARTWDTATARELDRFKRDERGILSAVLLRDGRALLGTGGPAGEGVAWLWTPGTGKAESFVGHDGHVNSVACSEDGRFVLTGSADRTARLWDIGTRAVLRRFLGHTGAVTAVGFSPDGRLVVTGSWDSTARIWDVATAKQHRRLVGHEGPVTSAMFLPSGRFVITGSVDQTTKLWSTQSGKEVCSILSLQRGRWVVIDAEGRFDASDGGDIEGLHWVLNNEPISLDQLKERYYDPGLLAKHLGFNNEPLRTVKEFTAPKLYPSMRAEMRGAELFVHLKNRGGGIGRVVVKVNGKERTADARARGADANAATMTVALNLADDPRLKLGEDNLIEVQAENAEGYLRSRGLTLGYRGVVPGGREIKAQRAPHLWAIIAGVSDYRGKKIDLRFAAKDAEDFATGLRAASERLFGKEHVHLTVLADAKRDTLVKALEAARKSRPSDILVLYLAGHGVNFGGQDGDFYYLTADASSANLKDPGVRAQVALSSRELTELIKQIPALKQVMILDTCASGRLIEKLTERRNVPGSQIRALERMKDRTGLHVLSGCAADSVSYETSRFGQGLLTYSLLLGMKGAALRKDEYVDVSRLFQFARDRVERLAKDIGGVQRPVLAAPKSGSFDLGRLTTEDKAKVPLRTPRPLFLRSSFQDERRFRDDLQLSKRVDALLADVAARGRKAPLVFVDASEFPDAFSIVGRYQSKDDEVLVSVILFRGEAEHGRFSITGTKTDLEALAKRILNETQRRLK